MQGEYPQALDFYQRSLKIREEIGDRDGVAKSLHQIGMLHQDQGEYPQALNFYQRSLKIKEEIGDRPGLARSLAETGLLYEEMDQPLKAIPLVVQAFLMFVGMNMPEGRTAFSALQRLRKQAGEQAFAQAVQAMGLPDETREFLLQALDSATSSGDVGSHGDARHRSSARSADQ